jgi:diguanylate cyclase (GGDEF)-like protein
MDALLCTGSNFRIRVFLRYNYANQLGINVTLNSLLTSGLAFDDNEEYLEFRFRMLNAVMLTGIFFSFLFVLIDLLGLNSLGNRQLMATVINCAASCGLLFFLRGRKEFYGPVSALFIAINFATFLSALVFVLNDELRVIWFFICLIVVYILHGLRAGIVMTVLTMVCILTANRFLELPFSRNALATLLIALSATSVISYAYTSRALSFFERLRASKQKLVELAEKDPLTGLLNPRSYYEVTNRMIWLAQRTSTRYAVLFIDLDHFKSVNDRFGHEAGDGVLRRVAQCLAANRRQSDIIGRIGGEEFSVFLPDTDLEGAVLLSEKLRSEIERLEHAVSDTKIIQMSASFGIARHLPTDHSVADIQKRADRAMYQAKKLGRNRVVVDTDFSTAFDSPSESVNQ